MSLFTHVPAIILSLEFFFAAIGRLTTALPTLHARVYRKSQLTAPQLFPVVPFKDNIGVHMRYVGSWLLFTGVLLAVPLTRGSKWTLGLVLFWTGAGAWSQYRCGMPYLVPVLNACLGLLVFWCENGNRD